MTWRSPAVVVDRDTIDDPTANHHDVERLLSEHGIPEPLWYDVTPGDPGTAAAARAVADGADLVLVQGGDGTVRACAAALAGGDVPLGILPSGLRTLLAGSIGVPHDLEAAVGVLAAGRTRAVDVAELDDEPFVVVGGVHALRATQAGPVEVVVDGTPSTVHAAGVVVGSVGTLTAGLPPGCGEADDGRLHVAVVAPWRWRDRAALRVRSLLRPCASPARVRLVGGHEVVLRWQRPVPVHADGDVVGERTTLRVTIRPQALSVCVPALEAS